VFGEHADSTKKSKGLNVTGRLPLRSEFRNSFDTRSSSKTIYDAIIRQSRVPEFYTKCGVPDDLVGRYNMIVIHLIILITASKKISDIATYDLNHGILESFTRDMDAMVRDLGVEDAHVEQEVKKVMDLCLSDMILYEKAITSADKKALSTAIASNFKNTSDHTKVADAALAGYILNSISSIQRQPLDSILKGHIEFSGVPSE
jgi:cytochrome b pre-mRNA-processing protein 3